MAMSRGLKSDGPGLYFYCFMDSRQLFNLFKLPQFRVYKQNYKSINDNNTFLTVLLWEESVCNAYPILTESA